MPTKVFVQTGSHTPLRYAGRLHDVTPPDTADVYGPARLTQNRGSDEYSDHASPTPALGGASAQPLRFLDFLIHEPIRTVMLHRFGVPVTVPAPERYAVHKLIVASRRRSDLNGLAKREKDVYQARLLIEALKETRRRDDLAEVFAEAWNRGPHWREAIKMGLNLLAEKHQEAIVITLKDGLSSIGLDLEGFGSNEATVKP